ncbi:HEAT repeat domain-containing protein [Leptospira sp. 96542]|nr:HEAT repeat domain-containing protein [Leptospira sp. 96542]
MNRFFIIFIYLFLMATIHCGENRNQTPSEPEVSVEEEIPTSVLLQNLDAEDVFTRSQATIQLGSRNVKVAIPKLRLLLNDKNPGVRAGAAIALGDLQDKKSTNTIVRLLSEDSENPKDVYLDALTRMKDVSASSSIYPLLDSDNPTLRLQTVEALVQLGAKQVGGQILILAKKNSDREKAKTFAMALGKLKFSPAESYLVGLTKLEDGSPTLAASYLALGRIGAKSSAQILVEAISKKYSKGKENASLALIEIGDAKVIPGVFPTLTSEDDETRMYGTDVLCNIPSIEAAKLAFGVLNSDKMKFWGSAAKVIGRQKYKEARSKLESLLVDKNAPDRDSFAEALGWIGDPGSIPVLRKVLVSGDKEGPYGSAWALGILRAEEAVPDLIDVLDGDDAKLTSYALEALGSIAHPSSLDALENFLKKRPKLAPQILSAITLIPTDRALDVLHSAMESKDEDVYRPAMEEVARRKDKKSIPILISFVRANNAEKRRLSYYALTSITGERFRTAKDWIDWASKNSIK